MLINTQRMLINFYCCLFTCEKLNEIMLYHVHLKEKKVGSGNPWHLPASTSMVLVSGIELLSIGVAREPSFRGPEYKQFSITNGTFAKKGIRYAINTIFVQVSKVF